LTGFSLVQVGLLRQQGVRDYQDDVGTDRRR